MPHSYAPNRACPPNKRVQASPLCGPEIIAFLKAGFDLKRFSLYGCGAADAQCVRRTEA
jgi:hypothetical protein